MNHFPTFVIIDESASLKRFDRLLEAIGRMRGYGVQFWLHLQALGQARLIYGEAWDLIPGLAGIGPVFWRHRRQNHCCQDVGSGRQEDHRGTR